MNINLPIYTIPSTVIYYDSLIKNKVAYIYGLSTNIDTGYTTVTEFPAGKYVDQYEPFFEFKYEDIQRSGDPFLNNYPYAKSFTEKINVYCIAYNNDNPNLYYYQYINFDKGYVTSSIINGEIMDGIMISGNIKLPDASLSTVNGKISAGVNISGNITYQQIIDSHIISGWTTDTNRILYFFTSGAAALHMPDQANNIICTHQYIIKNLILNDIKFPCSSFIIDDFSEYNN